jgi:uncharacterized protein YxjI
MGFFKKRIDKFIGKQAMRTAYHGVLKIQSDKRFVHNSKATNILVAERKMFVYKRGFIIKDENYDKIYVIKRQAMSGLNATLKICDLDKHKFAHVTRNPSFFSGRAEFDLYIREDYFGTIYQKERINPHFLFPMMGWRIDGNFSRGGYKVYDKSDSIVIRIRTANLGYDTYVIEFDNEEYELFALFILMAVELAYHR